MTIAAIANFVTYTGNGVTTNFPFTFDVEDEDHLLVYTKVISTDALTLIDAADYTVNLSGGTGSVDYNPSSVPVPSTKYLILYRLVPYSQEMAISNQSGFDPEVLEDQLDEIVKQTQQLDERLDRAIVVAIGETPPSADDLQGYIEDALAAVVIEEIGAATQSLSYTFDSATTDADPGAGEFRLNHATIASATAMYIDNDDNLAITMTAILDSWDDSTSTIRGRLSIRSQTSLLIRRDFDVTGSIVDGTGYRKVTIAYIGGAGAFVAAEAYWIQFTPKGDAGVGGDVTLAGSETLTNKTIVQPILTLEQGAAPTPTAEGRIAWDTDDNVLLIGDGAATKMFLPVPSGLAAGDVIYVSAAKVLSRLAIGTAAQILKVNAGATAPEWASGAGVNLASPYTTTGGTSVDFTGIPAGIKRVIIQLMGVSTSSTSHPMVQIGDSGGIETSGYLAVSTEVKDAGANNATGYTTGFGIYSDAAADNIRGTIVLTLGDSANNRWTVMGVLALSNADVTMQVAGDKALSAALDRIRLTTVGGAATFDVMNMNISYE